MAGPYLRDIYVLWRPAAVVAYVGSIYVCMEIGGNRLHSITRFTAY